MFRASVLTLVSFADAHSPSGDISCPGSPAGNHAWLTLTATATTTCDQVKAEMQARVSGQGSTWSDPHEGGTYSVETDAVANQLELSRLSANEVYTDKQLFTFTDNAEGGCDLTGCSESQGGSMMDQSTNLCNLWNMFCGADEECCPVLHRFTATHTVVDRLSQAGTNLNLCLGGSGGSGGSPAGERQSSCLADASDDGSASDPSPSPSPGPANTPTPSPTPEVESGAALPAVKSTCVLAVAASIALANSGL